MAFIAAKTTNNVGTNWPAPYGTTLFVYLVGVTNTAPFSSNLVITRSTTSSFDPVTYTFTWGNAVYTSSGGVWPSGFTITLASSDGNGTLRFKTDDFAPNFPVGSLTEYDTVSVAVVPTIGTVQTISTTNETYFIIDGTQAGDTITVLAAPTSGDLKLEVRNAADSTLITQIDNGGPGVSESLNFSVLSGVVYRVGVQHPSTYNLTISSLIPVTPTGLTYSSATRLLDWTDVLNAAGYKILLGGKLYDQIGAVSEYAVPTEASGAISVIAFSAVGSSVATGSLAVVPGYGDRPASGRAQMRGFTATFDLAADPKSRYGFANYVGG